ncbi:SDR family oxidoreductase [uncultured Cloacibacillus sp.]|uniref:SDR family NAD(P)-dependent oxidoreductase n=1 Tax=uncultured Cloacibacillus sp. TaxID=889794 RepID=UPI00320A0F59
MNADKDKKILVAGASKGIGFATAKMLLERGYKVIAAARNEEAMKEKFSGYDGVDIYSCDFSDIDAVQAFADKVNHESGPISGLVYTAGAQLTMPISMNKPDKVKELFTLNTFAPIELIRCFSKKKMISEDGASFVLISSLSAHEGATGKSLYAATKGALEGFLHTAALELVQRKIRLNAIVPGIIETDMSKEFLDRMTEEQRASIDKSYPLGLGKPENAASLIVWLLSDESRWATGQSYVIDGGHMIRG